MHAKIILLPGSQTGERLCSVAEEILTDISVSFGHTFSILRDKIGEAAERFYGTAFYIKNAFVLFHLYCRQRGLLAV